MGRLTFILFLIYSLPVGMPHLVMDSQHGNGMKVIHMLLTAFVAVPALLTVFTITASKEVAGRLRGGRGWFGWIGALPWERPMVLATGLAFVRVGFVGCWRWLRLSPVRLRPALTGRDRGMLSRPGAVTRLARTLKSWDHAQAWQAAACGRIPCRACHA